MYYPSLHGESPGVRVPTGHPGYIRAPHAFSPWEAPHFLDKGCCLGFWYSSGRGGLSANNGGPIMMTVSTRVLAAVSAIGLTATLASCQLGGGSDLNASGTATSASAPKSAQTGACAPGSNGAVIESHPTSIEGKAGTVSLNSVSGAGTTVTVMFSVTNNEKKDDMWIYSSFSDGDDSVPQPEGKASPGGSTNNVDGLTLIEPSSSNIYRVSYDSQGGCLCSSDLSDYVKPGQTVALQATFTGVPAEAKSVTITIPNGGTFSNVAVSR